jgi:hypothetical protein
VLEAGVSQPEVIEAMVERLSRDDNAEIAHVGEV